MTEEEWLACKRPAAMLEFLKGKASERKLRLFAVACCRPLGDLFQTPKKRNVPKVAETFFAVLTIAEQFAEGQVNEKERDAAYHRAIGCQRLVQSEWMMDALSAVMWAVAIPTDNSARTGRSVRGSGPQTWAANAARSANLGCKRQMPIQSHLLRDIFGNHSHPLSIDSSWLTSTVRSLAQAIYDERTFDRLPILTDALEDAGCTDTEVLAHCRGPGPHVRGCWVVDLILGKE